MNEKYISGFIHFSKMSGVISKVCESMFPNKIYCFKEYTYVMYVSNSKVCWVGIMGTLIPEKYVI